MISSAPPNTLTSSHQPARSRDPLYVLGRGGILLASGAIGLFTILEASPAIFITFCLFGLAGFLISSRMGATAVNLYSVVYAFSVIAAIWIYYVYLDRYGVPYYAGGSDDLHYENWGRDTAHWLGIFDYGSIRGTSVSPSHNSVGYVYLVSLLYRLGELLGGFHTMIPRTFNAMLLGLTAVVSYGLAARLLLPRRMTLIVGLAVGLTPIMVYNTVHTFRDVWMALLLLVAVYLWTPDLATSRPGSRLWRWAITLFLVLILSEFRFLQSLILLGVAFVGDVFATQRLSPVRQRLYAIFAFMVALVMLVLLREEILGISDRLSYSQENYANYRTGMADGLSSYVFNASPPLGYVLRIGYAVITPLPIPSTQLDRLWLSVGTLLQFAFLPFVGLGLLWAIKRRYTWPMLAAFGVLFGGMAFFTFTGRHIVQFYPYGILLAALGYLHYRRYRYLIWLLLGWGGVGLAVVYMLLR
ncbi:MAG: hypothetical protein KF893_01610 [Caldilineaceae bacterium]|nr:hypothetical protein [Caldilineaceae bacterium]